MLINLHQQLRQRAIINLILQTRNQRLGLIRIAGTQRRQLGRLKALQIGMLGHQPFQLADGRPALEPRVRVHVLLHLGQVLARRFGLAALAAGVEDGVDEQARFAHGEAVHVLEVAEAEDRAGFFVVGYAFAGAHFGRWRGLEGPLGGRACAIGEVVDYAVGGAAHDECAGLVERVERTEKDLEDCLK